MFAAPNTRARQFAIAALTVALLVATQNSSWAAAPTPLKKGDRVVLLGDSITAAGVRKTGFITMMREVIDKKHADLKVQLIGAGISGHKVPDCQKRLQRDVINKKPTIVFIYIGINDVWHSLSKRGTSKENFEKGLRRMIERINEAGGRVILCTPSVIGEKIGGVNKLDTMLDEYSDISRKVAKDTKSQLLDLRKLFVAHLAKENKEKNKPRGVLTSDGVHLNKHGNRFVAERMLEALGVKIDE
ncbi:MAG: SGNH/GDSL hydrolase family protein [Planctomycetes bacterium]|nr:SGNH/GDSL hydrolase family protein [Planctomycetota bacterium]